MFLPSNIFVLLADVSIKDRWNRVSGIRYQESDISIRV